MDWTLLLRLTTQIPLIIIGIQQIHGDATAGQTKKNLAFEALGLANLVADNVLPPDQKALADSTAQLVGGQIDTWVNAFKNLGQFGFKKSAPAPATGVQAQVHTADSSASA